MSFNTEQNKQTVIRFNKECIEEGKQESFNELLSGEVINHAVGKGMSNGKESFNFFLEKILRKGFSNIKVEILDQIAERDLVTTRKKILGKHTGEIFGIVPTNKEVEINIIDIIRLKNGKYVEHWGQSNFDAILKELSEN